MPDISVGRFFVDMDAWNLPQSDFDQVEFERTPALAAAAAAQARVSISQLTRVDTTWSPALRAGGVPPSMAAKSVR